MVSLPLLFAGVGSAWSANTVAVAPRLPGASARIVTVTVVDAPGASVPRTHGEPKTQPLVARTNIQAGVEITDERDVRSWRRTVVRDVKGKVDVLPERD